MFPNGFNTDGLFTIPTVEKGSDLNRFCRQEGMDYSQVISEAKSRNRWGKSRYIQLLQGLTGRSR